MFKKKKLTIQDSKKIINFLNVRKDMKEDEIGLDIGHSTVKLFKEYLTKIDT